MKHCYYSYQELDKAHQFIKKTAPDALVVGLQGDLGAGKTTLTQHMLKSAGVQGLITSPTFTYVNQYSGSYGKRYYHFDLYRLTDVDSFYEFGFDEYLYQPNSLCIIEWPEIIHTLLDSRAAVYTIKTVDMQTRCIMKLDKGDFDV